MYKKNSNFLNLLTNFQSNKIISYRFNILVDEKKRGKEKNGFQKE